MNIHKSPVRDYSGSILASSVGLVVKLIFIGMALTAAFTVLIFWRYVLIIAVVLAALWLLCVYPKQRLRREARDDIHIAKYGRSPRPWGDQMRNNRPW